MLLILGYTYGTNIRVIMQSGLVQDINLTNQYEEKKYPPPKKIQKKKKRGGGRREKQELGMDTNHVTGNQLCIHIYMQTGPDTNLKD